MKIRSTYFLALLIALAATFVPAASAASITPRQLSLRLSDFPEGTRLGIDRDSKGTGLGDGTECGRAYKAEFTTPEDEYGNLVYLARSAGAAHAIFRCLTVAHPEAFGQKNDSRASLRRIGSESVLYVGYERSLGHINDVVFREGRAVFVVALPVDPPFFTDLLVHSRRLDARAKKLLATR
jgi:hypothetical protein